ncbi:MAG TPA: flippase [Gemmatimonadaceae bacterium]|nr:flippase [Gemmatimonadaceae bacterium]
MTSGRVLARNTALNAVGQLLPLVAALVAVPLLVHGLGADRFAILALGWTAVGYFSLFDLGLGRALTHAVAVRLGTRDEAGLSTLAWSALAVMTALGAAGGAVLAAAAPWLATSALNVPPPLRVETVHAFWLLAASLPVVVATGGLRGLLEAHQDFGLATVLRLPLALFTFVGPLVVLPFTTRLEAVIGVLVVGRVVTGAAHLVACRRRYAYLRHAAGPRREVLAPLLRFGGWMTVTNAVSPLMLYADRFLIGALLPLAAVAYYTTPYELATKVLIVPQALVAALFPAMAASLASERGGADAGRLFDRGVRWTLAVVFPIVALFVLFAREGLTLWVGPAIARESALVLQWLALGLLVNSLGQPPYALLQAAGRPDLTAKLHLLELPLYALAIWWLATTFGLAGVAAAFALRVAVDTTVLLALAVRHAHPGRDALVRVARAALVLLAALAVVATLESLTVRLVGASLLLALHAGLSWLQLLTAAERGALRGPLTADG